MEILLGIIYIIGKLLKESYDVHKADEYARKHAKRQEV